MAIDVTKILEIIKDPDLKLKINDLYSENLQLKEENYNLKKEIEKLKEQNNIKSKLKFEDNHYFLIEGDKKDGPYCTNCFDADRKLIRLHKGDLSEGLQHFKCPTCKTYTHTGTYIPAPNLIDSEW